MYELARTKLLFTLAEKYKGRNISKKLQILKDLAKQSAEQSKAFQRQKLYQVICDASNTVPYYRDLFRSIKFDAELLKIDINYFKEIPYLTKEIILEQGSRLISEKFDKKSLHMRKTGGSTGLTLPIYYNDEALDWTSANSLHTLSYTGYKLGAKELLLSTDLCQEDTFIDSLSFRLKELVMNRQCMSITSLGEDDLALIWDKIKRFRPYIVHGSPSIAYALAHYVKSFSDQLPVNEGFKAFVSTGETLDEIKKQTIESILGCKVYNRYGNAEFGVVAKSQNNHDLLEIIEPIVYPENCSLGNGLSEIVLTGLTNMAMRSLESSLIVV